MSTEQVDKFEAAFLRKELEDMAEGKEQLIAEIERLAKFKVEETLGVAARMDELLARAEKAEARVKELEKCVAECLLLLGDIERLVES